MFVLVAFTLCAWPLACWIDWELQPKPRRFSYLDLAGPYFFGAAVFSLLAVIFT